MTDYERGMWDAWGACKRFCEDLFGQMAQDEIVKKWGLSCEFGGSISGAFYSKMPADVIAINKNCGIRPGDVCAYKRNPAQKFVVTKICFEEGKGFFDGIYEDGTTISDGSLHLIEKAGERKPAFVICEE